MSLIEKSSSTTLAGWSDFFCDAKHDRLTVPSLFSTAPFRYSPFVSGIQLQMPMPSTNLPYASSSFDFGKCFLQT